MKFPIGKILRIATRATLAVAQAVPAVQVLTAALASAQDGAAKKAAVVEFGKAELAAASAEVGRDLSLDGDVIAALGAISESVYQFHKLMAHKTGAVPAP